MGWCVLTDGTLLEGGWLQVHLELAVLLLRVQPTVAREHVVFALGGHVDAHLVQQPPRARVRAVMANPDLGDLSTHGQTHG